MTKALVAYFSASGVTAKLARNLAEAAGADGRSGRTVCELVEISAAWEES